MSSRKRAVFGFVSVYILAIIFSAKAQEPLEQIFLNGKWKTIEGPRILFPNEISDQPVAFVFLSPECPLCINYTSILSALVSQYQGKVRFYGIVSGNLYKKSALKAFAEKYHLDFPLLLDKDFTFSEILNAETTPECVVLDSQQVVRYRGAIDDRAPAPGKFRNQAAANYLKDALDSVLEGKPVLTGYMKAYGCFIHP